MRLTWKATSYQPHLNAWRHVHNFAHSCIVMFVSSMCWCTYGHLTMVILTASSSISMETYAAGTMCNCSSDLRRANSPKLFMIPSDSQFGLFMSVLLVR